MELRPAFQIKAVIKAMTDVILPAVDPEHKLAQEQARLCIGTLQLVLNRLPLDFAFQRDELERFLALARALANAAASQPAAGEALAELSQTAEKGADVLQRAQADPAELETANFDLREKIGALVPRLYANAELAELEDVSNLLIENAGEQLVRDRAWLIDQGWEANPDALPPIETLICKQGAGADS